MEKMRLVPIPHVAYDTIIIPKEIETNNDKICFFKNPLGTSFNNIDDGTKRIKNCYDTNMYCSGTFPSPQIFEIHNINISIPSVSFGLTRDIVELMRNSYFEINRYRSLELQLVWDMLTDCGGNYYYKGSFDCKQIMQVLEMGIVGSTLVFTGLPKFRNNIFVKFGFGGILHREIR